MTEPTIDELLEYLADIASYAARGKGAHYQAIRAILEHYQEGIEREQAEQGRTMNEKYILGRIAFRPIVNPVQTSAPLPKYAWGDPIADHTPVFDIRYGDVISAVVMRIDKRKHRVRFSGETEHEVTIHIEQIQV